MNYNFQTETLKRAIIALRAGIVKAALDGRWADKRGMEDALKDIGRAMTDAPNVHAGTVVCHMTLAELTDIELSVEKSMKSYETHGDNSAQIIARRLRRLLDRVHITITLNRPTGQEKSLGDLGEEIGRALSEF